MFVSYERRETMTAWTLGAYGFVEGMVRVFALEPIAEWLGKRRNVGSMALSHAVAGHNSHENVVPLYSAEPQVLAVINDERIAA